MKKFYIAFILILFLFVSCASSKKVDYKIDKTQWNTNYTYVFVHGLGGWGDYDFLTKFQPYWGMGTGSVTKFLRKNNVEAVSASVDPVGSVWDRTCELYAQLTGSRTDYGKAHSERCGHKRYGKDYSKKPLLKEKKWSSENKINLVAHSFGGVTSRLLSELMVNGSQEEREVTADEELSPLFAGGHKDWIYSVTCIASPHNGTTGYHVVDPNPKEGTLGQQFMDKTSKPKGDGRLRSDYCDYDMRIDNAADINAGIHTFENVYYFSFPCDASILQSDGTYLPDKQRMEGMFQRASYFIGVYEGGIFGDIVVDNTWRQNDGLVNVISARAPFNAPQKEFVEDEVSAGIWNIMPLYYGDHMSLQGGLKIKNEVKGFYLEQVNRINKL